jgi:hypothetical protein
MIRSGIVPLAAAVLLAGTAAGLAQGSDPIGLEQLRADYPALTGSGVIVAQVEAIFSGSDGYEVNPSATGQASSKFVYTGTDGSTAIGFPNSVGSESGHADSVGDLFYGDLNTSDPEGVAPGVSQIYNYEADYFVNNIVNDDTPIAARIVNQSFVALTGDNAEQAEVEEIYDTYAAENNTLFISGVGNGGAVLAPGSAYNGIGVAAYGGASSSGPTYDERSKPDITAPGPETSFSTPLVAGAAALLLQAAEAGDGGVGTATSAADSRVLKALLLNGAVKPAGWTNTPTAPLDPTYGAGVLNVYNSYMNLAAGEHAPTKSTSGAVSSIDTGTVEPDEGWDFATITNVRKDGSYEDESNHYLFDLSAAAAPDFQLTCTLTWWRQANQTSINNLFLYLFDATTGTLIDLSDSTVDNVQELFPMEDGQPMDLAPGDYDLVVTKEGGSLLGQGGNMVSTSEEYGLAFNFAPVPEPPGFCLALGGLAAVAAFGRGSLRRRKSGVS